jgi:hypothetical protein
LIKRTLNTEKYSRILLDEIFRDEYTNMATRQQITCVKKKHGFAPHEKITHIGGIFFGIRWTLSQEEAIAAVEKGIKKFYMLKNGQAHNIIVSREGENKYLKAEKDTFEPAILLTLNECPG